MSIYDSLKNAMLTGNGLVSWHNNTPIQYSGKQRQYFSPETRTFTQLYAQYSSDFVEAQMQGLAPEDPYAWQTRFLRFADVVKPSAAIQRHFDDYKMILIADRDVEYIVPGSKIVTMGSTWLVVNPMNVSGSDGAALVRRCNAVWNHLDYYGNVVSEPIIAENERANANDSDVQNSQLISKGYFNIICQANSDTLQIDTNTRMILGTGAYRITGFSDFEMEFTGDYNTVRLLSFTARFEAPNKTIDDMENHVAGGKNFSWGLSVSGANLMTVNTTAQLTATSVRNGQAVVSTEENPVSYLWESSDESVLTVDEDGIVTAVGEGSASVRVKLAQNTGIHTNFNIEVTAVRDGVFFVSAPPDTMRAYQSVTVSAAYFEDGEEQEDALTWALSGADANAYSHTVAADGKSIELKCFGYSASPLVVTAAHGTDAAVGKVALEGF